ncbi:NAD(P)/FAD-dependent oxidoreductase [uncultured Ilyobacter sp.]|uniref:NAD(P)/FAD-dependent oxidoreductase n=1 Tax=uncultured Ilyobacter sp. TaxID=544433 RepID=UPI0029C041FE|nr:NAD(P)/FAD-dependent oxidoreductase [uncultured Ilyobacter sp.]
MYDVAIIGAGVIGCAIARELSRYNLSIAVIEKTEDVSTGATKANSGIIHGGYDADHKKKKGYFSRKGNQRFDQLEKELNFGFSRCGSLVLAFSHEELEKLKEIKSNGEKNGVDDLSIIDADEIQKIDPNVSKEALYALYCPSAGIASPFEFCIALIENAIQNGAELFLNNEVKSIQKKEDSFSLITNKKRFEAKYVINCAGVYSDKVSQMAGIGGFQINPRKGEYLVFEKGTGTIINKVIFQCPTKKGKGILVTSTYHDNLMIGPDAQDIEDREDTTTSIEALEHIIEEARRSVPDFDIKKIIRSFSGIRASSSLKDFIVEETKLKGFVNVAGIESPGLTSSPEIAVYVSDILKKSGLKMTQKENFNPYREAIIKKKPKESMISMKEAMPLINLPLGDPDRIVCRCEQVSEKTIRNSLDRGIKVDSLDGVKRRTRAGMGVCQGQFCSSRVREVVSDHYHMPEDSVIERGPGSSSFPERVGNIVFRRPKK